MFKQPSIRHLAVSKLVLRRTWGSVWTTHDRRDSKPYWLVTPSFLVCWPRLMATLQTLDSIAVRLRNNKVAVLVPASFTLREVSLAIRRARKGTVRFDVFKGFANSKHSNVRRIFIFLLLASVLTLVLRFPETENEPKRVTRSACQGKPQIGDVLSRASLKEVTTLGSVKLQILTSKSFGGLLEIKALRICDKNHVKLRLWARGAEYVLTGVS